MILIVTGTGTGVGKTVVTAALAGCVRARGAEVAVCKPVQTGSRPAHGPADDDLAEVARLSGMVDMVGVELVGVDLVGVELVGVELVGVELVGVARYSEPLAPAAAAEVDGVPLPTAADILAAVRSLDRPGRLTLVEGAGGVLVELTAGGETLRDLAVDLGAPVLVVCAPGLGTLNHTALTLEALEHKGLSCAGLVIGSWPDQPGAAERFNRVALARLAPVRAVLPAGAAQLSVADFTEMSRRAFDADWVSGLI